MRGEFEADSTLMESLEETPYYHRRGRVSKFSHIKEEEMGIENADLVVFGDGETLWPKKARRLLDEGSFRAEVPDDYVKCDECEAWCTPKRRASRFTDEKNFCSQGCLREYLDENTTPKRDGRMSDEGTKLY